MLCKVCSNLSNCVNNQFLYNDINLLNIFPERRSLRWNSLPGLKRTQGMIELWVFINTGPPLQIKDCSPERNLVTENIVPLALFIGGTPFQSMPKRRFPR